MWSFNNCNHAYNKHLEIPYLYYTVQDVTSLVTSFRVGSRCILLCRLYHLYIHLLNCTRLLIEWTVL